MAMRWAGYCSIHNSWSCESRVGRGPDHVFSTMLDRHSRLCWLAAPLSAFRRPLNDKRPHVRPLIVMAMSSTLHE